MCRAIEQARERDEHVIYVNDNYGLWSSDRGRLIEYVLDRCPDSGLVEPILPGDDDPFVFKARHTIFFETSLGYLLSRQLGVERLTLVGQVTEQCVLYSALDAYVRHFAVRVPVDAVVAIDDGLAASALRMIERNMRGELLHVGDRPTAQRT
jgi:nicotinamidase-related amidase